MDDSSFLAQLKKVKSGFDGSGWSDDLSRRFEQSHLVLMEETLRDLAETEESISELDQEIRAMCRFS